MSSWGDIALEVARNNPEVTIPQEGLDYLAGKGKKKGNKFGAVKVQYGELKFDSKAEMARYGELRLLELAHQIKDLKLQPKFILTGGVGYRGDFQYIENGKMVVEDVKGAKKGKSNKARRGTITQSFINKWKQVKELFPNIEFRLIER